MNEQPCIRCGQPVLLESGHLVFCSHCGAPQIFVSEAMQAVFDQAAEAGKEQTAPEQGPGTANNVRRRSHASGPAGDDAAQGGWATAVQGALLSAGLALVLGLLSLALPPVGLLFLLGIAIAPVLNVSFFYSRTGSQASRHAGFAARLGLLTGLLITLSAAAVWTLHLVLSRFVFHQAAVLDTQLNLAFAQQRTAVLARLGAEAQPTLDLFALPEFRVGLLLSAFLFSGGFYLLLSSLAGALAGAILRRRERA